MSSVVLEEHGPTLPELVGTRLSRGARLALAAVLVLVALGIAAAVLLPASGERHYVGSVDGLDFNFVHDERLRAVAPRRGEVLRLEAEVNGRFAQSFSVLPLALPPYRGVAASILPVLAHRQIAELARTRDQFELVGEGKARVVEAAGYSISYRARLGERRLYGRLVLLPSAEPGTRRGVLLQVEATPIAGVPRAADVGARGLTKKPFRSFRYGKDRP